MLQKITIRPINRKGAAELLELLFVTLLLGSVGIAMYFTLVFGEKAGLRARHYARASQIAAQEMETVRSTSFANLTTPYNGAFIGNAQLATELPSGTTNLTTSYYNSPTNTIKRAVVTVSWNENGQPRSVVYTTLVAEQGVGQ
jgi:hypothetical protein